MDPNQPQVVVATGAEPVAASDIARQDPGYDPAFGAHGTGGERPPSDAQHYSDREAAAAQFVATAQPPVNPVVQPPAPPMAPAAPNLIQDVTPPPMPQPPLSPAATAPLPPQQPQVPVLPTGDATTRIKNLEDQVSNLGTLLATVSNQLTAIANPPVAPAIPQVPIATTDRVPVNGTNTGGGGQQPQPQLPTPNAPTPHLPGQNPLPPQSTAPVIPAPVPPVSEQKVHQIPEDEGNLTVGEYIEKHFRQRDRSIDQMAVELRMDPMEVTNILKELGYQFPDGV